METMGRAFLMDFCNNTSTKAVMNRPIKLSLLSASAPDLTVLKIRLKL